MGTTERRERQQREREKRIVGAARRIAEAEGWDAVTIRRLASEIEYSQPVLYTHFEGRDAIVAAVAIEGFEEFTEALGRAADGAIDHRVSASRVAQAYLTFARENPALYAAMFTLPSSLRFAEAGAKPELKAAFAAIAAALAPSAPDRELTTETFWACLHGLAELERTGRIRISARDDRLAMLVATLL